MVEQQTNNLNQTSKHHRIYAVMFAVLALLAIGYLLTARGNKIPAKQEASLPASSAYTLNKSKPVSITIEKIGVNADVIDLGLNPDQTLEVPQEYEKVGWYEQSPTPGELGPSIMVGHLDSEKSKAVFFRLKELQPGDKIVVKREDGSTATFAVNSSETYPQDNFPTEKVYGPTDYAALRLITCAGKWNFLQRHYSDNLIVYASLLKNP